MADDDEDLLQWQLIEAGGSEKVALRRSEEQDLRVN